MDLSERFDFKGTRAIDDYPRTQGHFARCYRAYDRHTGKYVALKYLRHLLEGGNGFLLPPSEADYQVFYREAGFLERLYPRLSGQDGVARIPQLLGYGYLQGLESTKENPDPITGSFNEVETLEDFGDQLLLRKEDNWRPFLLLEYFPIQKSMVYIRDWYKDLFPALREIDHIKYPHLPLFQTLQFALQVARLMKVIHYNPDESGGPIVYPDSKLPHFFWNGSQTVLIDWNRAYYQSESNNEDIRTPFTLSERRDIQNFVAVLLYELLTGRDSGGVDPHFGIGNDRQDPNSIPGIIRSGYSEQIFQLFYDVLMPDGEILDAYSFENRCETLLEDLFGYPDSAEYQQLASIFKGINHIATLLGQVSNSISKLFLNKNRGPDTDYVMSIVRYIETHEIQPWSNNEKDSGNF